MKDIFPLAEIIRKSLDGTISPAERQSLDAWLQADEKHRVLYDDIRREGYLGEKIAEHGVFSVERGYRRFMRDVRGRSVRKKRIRWSAAAAILAAAGIWLFAPDVPDAPDREPVSIVTRARPGTTHAILTLADGRQVELTDTVNTSLEAEDTRIEIRHGVIGYASEGKDANAARHKLTTPNGGEHQLTLSDGTRVWLNAASELVYPALFAGGGREVWLTGEAYFEVAEERGKPFFVRTANMDIRVTGTAFNVRAYRDEDEQATLVEGSVEVRTGSTSHKLVPGDRINVTGEGIEMARVRVQSYGVWKNERFIFNDESLENVMRKLERWYDAKIVVADPDVRQYRFTGNVPKYAELQDVLKKLELTTRIRFEEERDAIRVVKDSE